MSKYIGQQFDSEQGFDNLMFGTIFKFTKHKHINMLESKLRYKLTNKQINESEFFNEKDDEVFGLDELAASLLVDTANPETALMQKDNQRILNEALYITNIDAPKSTELMIKWAHDEVVTSYDHRIKSHYTVGKKRLYNLLRRDEISFSAYNETVFTYFGKKLGSERIKHIGCTQPGCKRVHKSKGLCDKHYQLSIKGRLQNEQQALPSLHNN